MHWLTLNSQFERVLLDSLGMFRLRVILVAAITAVSAVSATGQERLAASDIGDVQAHFADCFRSPHDTDASLITFYFSLTRMGQVYGRLRVVLLGFNVSPESRRLFVGSFLKAFSECLPIPLGEELARTIPGKVYFLQFNVRTSGEVILRPYGSHIGPE